MVHCVNNCHGVGVMDRLEIHDYITHGAGQGGGAHMRTSFMTTLHTFCDKGGQATKLQLRLSRQRHVDGKHGHRQVIKRLQRENLVPDYHLDGLRNDRWT
jgi:hypothetical protein